MILLDVLPPFLESPIALGLSVGFFLVLIAIAFIAFKMLKRTVKMAVRMIVVAVIVLIAIIGSVALLIGVGSATNNHHYPPRQTVNSTR